MTLEKCLILDDFLELSKGKYFSQRMIKYLMRNGSLSLNYCMKLLRHGPDTFTQFIDILIETKQNAIMLLLLTTA